VNALVFLGIAVGLSAVGCLVLWLRSRQPGSMDAHIRDFARELDALAPGSPLDRTRGRQPPRDDRPPAAPGPQQPPVAGARRPRPPEPERGPRSG
jgi:hypothetical protein